MKKLKTGNTTKKFILKKIFKNIKNKQNLKKIKLKKKLKKNFICVKLQRNQNFTITFEISAISTKKINCVYKFVFQTLFIYRGRETP